MTHTNTTDRRCNCETESAQFAVSIQISKNLINVMEFSFGSMKGNHSNHLLFHQRGHKCPDH